MRSSSAPVSLPHSSSSASPGTSVGVEIIAKIRSGELIGNGLTGEGIST